MNDTNNITKFKMSRLPLNTSSCSTNESINKLYSESSSKTKMINMCQSMILIAALACSFPAVDAFSSGGYFGARSSTCLTKQISPLKQPAFISNQRPGTSKPRNILLFATQKETRLSNKKSSSSSSPDAQEWDALLAAFQMYKAAYGDLKVPSRFVVPSMPPWPGMLLTLHDDCLEIDTISFGSYLMIFILIQISQSLFLTTLSPFFHSL